ncbi:hypothetical protein G5V59_09645 [Nocardioides sp. W3-2-3]|uniref:hypothetical protein n=1 Tax=Nocardioides convexus TaxID=2712224 RepID=UPI0024181D0D|nr:hypothetical protein [Nocardioides convexus]NHA00275.1 hypothetical protein [Nocardioides convexus]
MTWKAYHNRGETLRAVIATSSVRRDGRLPMDVAGVSETFRDETRPAGRAHAEVAHPSLRQHRADARPPAHRPRRGRHRRVEQHRARACPASG